MLEWKEPNFIIHREIMMAILKSLFSVALLSFAPYLFAQSHDITGKWRTIDDVTGFSKAIVEINRDPSGVYYGTIIQVLPRPGYTPKTYCTKCTGQLKNYPVIGFPVLSGLVHSKHDPTVFEQGLVIDPLSGRIYKGLAYISDSGSHLTLRAFIGTKAIGRS